MSDVWSNEPEATPSIPVKVNGETVGSAEATETLAEVANEFSMNHGLKTYNVLVNGQKQDKSAGPHTLAQLGATVVELVAKDARG